MSFEFVALSPLGGPPHQTSQTFRCGENHAALSGMPAPHGPRPDSAAVRHWGHFSELARVDGQRAAMMRGVLHHGTDYFADGLAAHDGTGRERPREILGAG